MQRIDQDTDERFLKVLAYGSPGCIAGDMHVPYVIRDQGGVNQNVKGGSMERLYKRFNKIPIPGSGSYQRPETINSQYFVACMDEHRKIAVREIGAVLDSGVRRCVMVTTVGGLQVTCTPDHPFATDMGYVPIESIGVGGKILVHRGVVWSAESSRKPRTNRPEVMVKHHPFASTKTVRTSSGDYEYKRLSRARAVLEASMNNISIDEYIGRLNRGRLDGLEFIQPGMDVHHLDENPLNDVPENLIAISHAEHTLEHDPSARLKYLAVEDEVESIVDAGVQHTYDIQMKEAPRNFVVEGFVVHNTGKTSLGVTAPDPLFLLSERQGMTHIRHAAARLGVPMPKVLFMENAQSYRDVLRTLRQPRAKDFVVTDQKNKEVMRIPNFWPSTIVIDSITDAHKLIADEVQLASPPRIGKDGLPVLAERYWGVLIDRCEKMIRAFRDVPMHVLFLALLADDRKDDDDDEETAKVGPIVATKGLRNSLAAAVNVAGVSYRRPKKAEDGTIVRVEGQVIYEFGVLTFGPSYMITKPLRPLRDREVAHFGSWVSRVFPATEDAPVQPEEAPAIEDVNDIAREDGAEKEEAES